MSEQEFLGWLVGGLITLGGAAVMVKKLWGKTEPRKIEPQPLEVKVADEWARQRDLDALRIEMNARIEAHERRNDADMAIIRSDLAELRKGTDYVQKRVNGMSSMVYAIAGKMGIVPGGLPQQEG